MPTITGTPGNDTLGGTTGTDLIQGLAGNDTLTDTTSGSDTLDGGDGDDLIVVSRATQGDHETLLGGNGNDTLRFTGARDLEDFISGGAGDDRIEATGFGFFADAGSGDDSVYLRKLFGDVPTVTLGSGSDVIGFTGVDFGGQQVVVTDFAAGDGGDRIDWGLALVSLWEWDQSGNPFGLGYLSVMQSGDIVFVQVKPNLAAGGSNIFFLSGFAPSALTAFNFSGYAPDGSAPANLSLAGGAAAETLNGGTGNDTLHGDAGDDILSAGAGHDEIHGGADNDAIDAGLGNDIVFGDGGDDVIVDDFGYRGTIDGGAGNDTITIDLNQHPSLPLPQPIAPVMFARTIEGGDGEDRITLYGYAKGGTQRVTEGTIDGGADNDVIAVANISATIDAGSGDDTVIVYYATPTNTSTITLGGGVDTLRLLVTAGASIGAVTVTDFVAGAGGDVVDMAAVMASRNFGWDYQGNPFAGGFVRLIASGADTLLQGKTGSSTYATLAILQGVAPGAFTAENLGGFDPGGAPPPPQSIGGTANGDTIAGTVGDDTMSGLAGDDRLTGGFGNDILDGGDDSDTLDGEWANDIVNGGEGDDVVTDTRGGNDTLGGGNGNDVVTDTGGGNDVLNGGEGDDILTDSAGGNDIFNGGGGNDTITAQRTVNATLTVDAGDGDDSITLTRANGSVLGGAGNDVMVIDTALTMTVNGGAGDDDITIDAATVIGGAGNDIIRSKGGTQVLTLGAGKDIVLIQSNSANMTIQDFQVGEEGDRLDLSSFGANPFGAGGNLIIEQVGADTRIRSLGNAHVLLLLNVTGTELSTYNLGVPTGAFNPAARTFNGTPGPDEYISADGNDTLSGLGGNDALYGAGGNDFIDGGAGADAMSGGTGNDVFIVDQAGDQIAENAGAGRDVVYAAAGYTLASGASIEVLSALSQTATTAIELIGNALDQDIYGNAGANFLQGGGGNDYLFGLGGDDSYLVAGPGDHIVEQAGGGRDIVYALADFVLGAGVEIEILSASSQAGTAPIELVGNALGQEIYGNAGDNFLQGGGGTDYLIGLEGNDRYLVAGPGDNVIEGAGGGARDVIYATGDYVMVGGLDVEVLSSANQAGTSAQRLIGNALAQEIYGNNGANFIEGGGGADYLAGLGGDDVYVIDGADDFVAEAVGGGRDVVYAQAGYALGAGQEIEVLSAHSQGGTGALDLTGNELANELYGNAGANVLNGGAGADYLAGYGGADAFAFTTALGGGNVDAIADFLSGTDTIRLDDAVFAGLAPGALAASAFVAGAAAQDADDRIVYNSATGQILFDSDGNGAGAAILFATVQAGTVLSAGDFTVI
jgi:Ca2+-binding RTX toxin-like protein